MTLKNGHQMVFVAVTCVVAHRSVCFERLTCKAPPLRSGAGDGHQ